MSLQTRRSILKAWNISSAIAWVAPDSLKSMTILSDTTFRRSAVEQEDLKPYWKSQKSWISGGDSQACYLDIFQRFY